MDAFEKYVRTEITRYRGGRAINLMKSVTLTVIGAALILASLFGDIFDRTNGEPDTPLYKTLGPDGIRLIAVGIGILVLLFGLIWSYRLIRDLTKGVKAYEQQLRSAPKGFLDSVEFK